MKKKSQICWLFWIEFAISWKRIFLSDSKFGIDVSGNQKRIADEMTFLRCFCIEYGKLLTSWQVSRFCFWGIHLWHLEKNVGEDNLLGYRVFLSNLERNRIQKLSKKWRENVDDPNQIQNFPHQSFFSKNHSRRYRLMSNKW